MSMTGDGAELNCEKSVSNSHEGIDAMLGVGEKNYRDGYIPKEQYEKMAGELKKMMASITVSDCQSATGKQQGFYRCMSDDNSLFIACAQTHQ